MRSAILLAPTLYALCSFAQSGADRNSQPSITPAPRIDLRKVVRAPQVTAPPDPVSLASILLTAVPASLRGLAATNLPAASKILWSEFLDDNTPSWFGALPSDIQTYLHNAFAPSTAIWTPTITPQSSSESSSQQTTTSSPDPTSNSNTPVITSLITVTVGAQSTPTPPQEEDSPSKLSTGAKIGIGIGVAIGVLLLLALLAACCLMLRRRRRQRRTDKHVDSRPPTPAFLSSTMARKPVPLRGGAGSTPAMTEASAPLARHSDGYDSGVGGMTSPFADPPPAAAGAVGTRQSKGSHNSFGSLTSVPEEAGHGDLGTRTRPGYPDMGFVPPARSQRRSRGSLSEVKHQPTITTTSVMPMDQKRRSNGSVTSPLSPLNPNHGSGDWQNQHPAFRNRDSGSFSTPYGPYGNATTVKGGFGSNDAVSPVMSGANGHSNFGGGYGSYSNTTPRSQRVTDPMLPKTYEDSPVTQSPSRGWPLGGNSPSGKSGYWKVSRPKYDRYQKVYDGT